MRHEYEPFLKKAEDEVDDMNAVETALAAANNQIKLSIGGAEALSDADESDDEKGDDEENEKEES